MRLIVLLPALLALTACLPGGGSDGESVSAEDTRRTTTDVVEEAVPLTAQALGAHKVDMHAEWFECMKGLSWKYNGGGALTAPSGDVAARLKAIKASLLDAGFAEKLTSDNQVSVERDGISFTVLRPATTRPTVWTVAFESDCSPYSEDDQALIDQDPGDDFEDLGR